MKKLFITSLVFTLLFHATVRTMEQNLQETCQFILNSGIPIYLKKQALGTFKNPSLTKPFEEKLTEIEQEVNKSHDQIPEFIETADNYKQKGKYAVIKALLEAGVDTIKDNYMLSDFFFNINNGPIYECQTYWTHALHQAIKYYDVEEVKQLVATHGNTIIASSGHGSTTLPYAKSCKYRLKRQRQPNPTHLEAIKNIINFIEKHGGDVAYSINSPQGKLITTLRSAKKETTREEIKQALKKLRRVEKTVGLTNPEQIKLVCTNITQGSSPEEVIEVLKKFKETVEFYKAIFNFHSLNINTQEGTQVPQHTYEKEVLIRKMVLKEKSKEQIVKAEEVFQHIIPLVSTPNEKKIMYGMIIEGMPIEEIINTINQYRLLFEQEKPMISGRGLLTTKLLRKMLYAKKPMEAIIPALHYFNRIQDCYKEHEKYLSTAEQKFVYTELIAGKSDEEIISHLSITQEK